MSKVLLSGDGGILIDRHDKSRAEFYLRTVYVVTDTISSKVIKYTTCLEDAVLVVDSASNHPERYIIIPTQAYVFSGYEDQE